MQDWLDRIGLGHLGQVFGDQGILAGQLVELTDADLRELGLTMGDRKRLRRALGDGGPPGTAPRPVPAEHRPLAVMFVDLVDSTAMSGRMEPEDWLEMLRLYRAHCAAEIARFGGHVAQLMGDGILAYFCYPVASENDTERAIRAALAIVQGIAAVPGGPETLRVRIGIAAGRVLIGSLYQAPGTDPQLATGSAINLAARLQTLAPPNGIVVSELAHERVSFLFACHDLGPQHLKGFGNPEHVFQVLRALPDSQARRGARPRLTPLFGREAELSALAELWRKAEAGRGGVAVVVGEAGIGKSRLVERFLATLAGRQAHTTRITASAFDQDSSLRPFLAHFQIIAGFEPEDDAEARHAKLATVLRGPCRDADLRALSDVMLLRRDPELAAQPPAVLRERALGALCAQIQAPCADGPTCVLVEDLHWLDPTSCALLQRLAAGIADRPLLLLATCRDPAEAEKAGLSGAAMLPLRRLTPGEVSEMVRALFGEEPPDVVAARIAAQTDGIPLFVEEYVRPALRAGAGTDWGWALASDVGPGAVPATLQESLTARLDRSGSAKQLAQVAAVIGRVAPRDLLEAVSGLEPAVFAEALATLVATGVLYAHSEDGRDCFTFSHALLRDTAYDSLLRGVRRELHVRTARALVALDPQGMERQPQLLAIHLMEGGLLREAMDQWLLAGRESVRRSALLEASRALERGLALARSLPPVPGHQETQLELMALLGPALIALRGPGSAEVQALYAEAYALVQQRRETGQDHPAHFPLLWGWWRLSPNFRVKEERATVLLAGAAGRGQPGLTLQAHHCNWATCFYAADFGGCRDHVESGMAIYGQGDYRQHAQLYGNHDAKVCAHGELAQIGWMQGRLRSALAEEAHSLATARTLGHIGSYAHALDMALLHRSYRRDLTATRDLAEEMMAFSAGHGMADHWAKGALFGGWSSAALGGDLPRGLATFEQALSRHRDIGSIEDFPIYLSLHAELLLMAGRPDRAIDVLTAGRAEFAAAGLEVWKPEISRMLGQAMLAADPASRDAAHALFLEAGALARAQGVPMLGLRASLSRSELLAASGEADAAWQGLDAALRDIPEPVDDEPALREAGRIRAALAGRLGLHDAACGI